MSVSGVDGLAVAAMAGGGVLIWSGVKGTSPLTGLHDILTGKQPSKTQVTGLQGTAAIGDPAGATTAGTVVTGGSASGSAIASDALSYVGQGYRYGGPSTPGKWDCSSFASYVLGHDMGLPIPGGSWVTVTSAGTTHGPATGSYMGFGTGVPLSAAQPGDLLVSADHMGFVVSAGGGGGTFVSAQDEALGVGVAGWPGGFPAGPPVCRRVS